MTDEARFAHLSPFTTGLACRCPRCGQGRLFVSFLTLAPSCKSCGLDFAFADSGDGPAVFIILIVGVLVVGGALITEVAYQPAYWLHALIWLPLVILLPALLLRPAKGLMIALQFKNKAQEWRRS